MTPLLPAFPSPRFAAAPSRRFPVPGSGLDQVVDSLDAGCCGAMVHTFRRWQSSRPALGWRAVEGEIDATGGFPLRAGWGPAWPHKPSQRGSTPRPATSFRRKATGDGRNDGLASGFFGVVGIPSRRILRRFAQRPANRNTGPVQTSPTASAVNGRTAGKTAGVRKRGSGVRQYQGHGMAYNPAAMRTIARGGHGAQACNRSLATGAGVNPARVHLTAFSLHAVRPGCDTGTGRTPPGTPFPIGGTAPTPNPRRDER